MRLHKEGNCIIIFAFIVLVIFGILFCFISKPCFVFIGLEAALLVLFVFIVRFFRVPKRSFNPDANSILSGADGTVCAIEEVEEEEYFQDKRLLVSVFMSINDVHINWYSVGGVIKYFKYHSGKYIIASHPKSSTHNERTTVVIGMDSGIEIMQRQIAGYVARRVVCYSEVGKKVEQCDQMGFIKFGSRIDHYLPTDVLINVKVGDKVVGGVTPIAKFNG